MLKRWFTFAQRSSSSVSSSPWPWLQPTGTTTIRLDGRTNLHNRYPYRYAQHRERGKGQPGPVRYMVPGLRLDAAWTKVSGYTTTRTASTVRNVARLHTALAVHQFTYLITHTMSDAADMYLRRKMFRRLLDRIRKLPGYQGSMWTTERHKTGHLHHHLVLRTDKRWNYVPCIVSWSQRYCGSPNGLDVSDPLEESNAAHYGVKAFGYAAKGVGEADVLPFRWWGTSKLKRKVRVPDCDIPMMYAIAARTRFPQCARLPRAWAVHACAQATHRFEMCRQRRRIARSRIKTPCAPCREHLQFLFPDRADHTARDR